MFDLSGTDLSGSGPDKVVARSPRKDGNKDDTTNDKESGPAVWKIGLYVPSAGSLHTVVVARAEPDNPAQYF